MFVSADKIVSVFNVFEWFLEKIAEHHARKMLKADRKIEELTRIHNLHLIEGKKAVTLNDKLKAL